MNDSQGSSSEDEHLRLLLDDAVSDVEPRPTLDSIRTRTAAAPSGSRRPWMLGAGGAAVATAATIAAVALMSGNPGVTGDVHPDPGFTKPPDAACTATTSTEPSSRSEEESSPSDVPSDSTLSPHVEMTVPIYFLGEAGAGTRLFREEHTFTAPEAERGAAAVRRALQPAVDPDYRTGWPDGVSAESVTLDGDAITVDLSAATDLRARPTGMTAEEATMAVQQLIYTAQGSMQVGRRPVRFLLDGQPVDTLLGVDTTEPLPQLASLQALARVRITSPNECERVSSPFQVVGDAAVTEATVQWELLRDGDVVRSGHDTAATCCTFAAYAFRVEAPPGEYTLRVHDTDDSGGEGFGITTDTRTVLVH